MLEKVLDYERGLFFFLNGNHTEFMDRFMWLFSGQKVWLPIALLMIVILLYKKGWKESLFIIIAIALVVTLCDQFASGICKPLFTRFRPTHHPEFQDLVQTVFNKRGGQYGFISSHAANAFGFATFMVLMFRNALFSWVIYAWATVTAYSRIYLGVHFISDIIPGIIAGLVLGYFVYCIDKWSRQRILATTASAEGAEIVAPVVYTNKQKRIVVYGLLGTIVIMLIFNAALVDLIG